MGFYAPKRLWLVSLLILTFSNSISCSVSYRVDDRHLQLVFSNGTSNETDDFSSKLRECLQNNSQVLELSIHLKNCTFPAFPEGFFANFGHLNRLKLELSDNSLVKLLAPSIPEYALFENSSFDSIIFDVTDSPTLVGWNWTRLYNLTTGNTNEFNVVRSKLVYLHPDFSRILKGQLRAVRILKCSLKILGSNVFASFTHLRTLELRNNLLEELHRSHLPLHAHEMHTLDLGYNKLSYLPEDIFDGLHLKKILLEGNNLKISSELAVRLEQKIEQNLIVIGGILPCKHKILLNVRIAESKFEECYEEDL